MIIPEVTQTIEFIDRYVFQLSYGPWVAPEIRRQKGREPRTTALIGSRLAGVSPSYGPWWFRTTVTNVTNHG